MGLGSWWHEIFECDQSALTDFLTDFDVDDDRIDWLTDIFLWTPFSVVSARVREFFEDTDPDGHMFFPVKLFAKKSGKELPGRYFTWIPKRRLFFTGDIDAPLENKVIKRWDGPFALSTYATELTRNQPLRAFANSLNTFCIGFRPSTAFNSTTFHALKAEKFTGLVEREIDDDIDDDPTWNVGHYA